MTPVARAPAKNRRFTLTTLLGGGLLVIMLLFITVTGITFSRLIDVQQILNSITHSSIPTVIKSARIFSLVNELTYLTESLTHASSQSQRHNAHSAITDKIAEIRQFNQRHGIGEELNQQLQIIEDEQSNLNGLTEQRLEQRHSLLQQENLLVELFQQVQEYQLTLAHSEAQQTAINQWFMFFARLASLSTQVTELRSTDAQLSLRQQIRESLIALRLQQQQLTAQQHVQLMPYLQRLETLLVDDEGLLSLSMNQSRLQTRTTSKGNFVRTLVMDYATQTEYQTYAFSQDILKQSQKSAESVGVQIRLVGIISIAILLLVLGITYLIQRRIVRRLKRLNLLVTEEATSMRGYDDLNGKDEIAEIAHSLTSYASTVVRQREALERQSLTDSLTGIPNRRAFDQRLKRMLRESREREEFFQLLMIDIDFFKAYNDTYGHLAGDAALQQVARCLEKHLQVNGALVARYGGEEFACLLPNCPRSVAEQQVIALLDAVRKLDIPHESSKSAHCITLSLGIGTWNPTAAVDDDTLLRQADEALYVAKREGRNQYR
ncbi:diguanylate cyclase domain-containing protein [Pokkaliibacter sp. CJK22405]|uniref:GGDEF domain-containing protein n=1 Tax=Pokkaliibacter sp. CJK22405 TaxID=3384615 RepID=UPI0039848C0E